MTHLSRKVWLGDVTDDLRLEFRRLKRRAYEYAETRDVVCEEALEITSSRYREALDQCAALMGVV